VPKSIDVSEMIFGGQQMASSGREWARRETIACLGQAEPGILA